MLQVSVYPYLHNGLVTAGILIATYMASKTTPKRKSEIPCVTTPVKVAILIDGGFFLKRYNHLYNTTRTKTAADVANDIYRLAHSHVGGENYLYRIYYYDCIPFDKRVHNPVSKRCINFAKSDLAKFKNELIEELKKKRKVALRLGVLKSGDWQLRANVVKDVIDGTTSFSIWPFKKVGITTIEELLAYYPRAYDQFEGPKPIADVAEGQAVVSGVILKDATVRRAGRMQLTEVQIRDESGTIKGVWFNSPFLKNPPPEPGADQC